MTKKERILTKFECDTCKKESDENEQPRNFPYKDGWIFIYNIEFKKDKDKSFNFKDKHFCSKECLIKFIENKLIS